VKRREFITLLGGATAWPLAARAQQTERMRRVGVLMADAEDEPGVKARLAAFREGLDRLGWSLDRNIRIDYRFAANPDQYQLLAKELVRLQPDVLSAHTTPVAAAFQRESRTIPIVFMSASDPIGSGLVASLARPGGNLTGLLLYEEGITGKWLAMLKEIAPDLSRAALMANPKRSPYDYFMRSAKSVAPALAIE
jgi:putative tryptophan/tyrosine transport system substrate-binding protein